MEQNDFVRILIQDFIGRLEPQPWKVTEDSVEWWSFPCAFSSTTGPRGGGGGQAITKFQVYAFETNHIETGPNAMKWCDGVWKIWDTRNDELLKW